MRQSPVIALILSLVVWSSPAWAETSDEDTFGPQPLRFRVELGLGGATCVNAGNSNCNRWPSRGYTNNTGGYARVGASLFLPDPVDFLSAGLTLDLGGYSLSASNETSITFHLVGMLRAFIPLEAEGFEATVGVGLGLAHWAHGGDASWTGFTVPISLGMGYEVYEGLSVGADTTFHPRIGGDAPHNIHFGLYATYTFAASLRTPAATRLHGL